MMCRIKYQSELDVTPPRIHQRLRLMLSHGSIGLGGPPQGLPILISAAGKRKELPFCWRLPRNAIYFWFHSIGQKLVTGSPEATREAVNVAIQLSANVSSVCKEWISGSWHSRSQTIIISVK